ncbi:MAG: M1 family metallopeptidase [Sediminibacterium sp.]|nr:M1 family metallopeptidase [Sediminibacterium sp.]MBX9781369.1 M1 family metallopeptidase [Chitinophagaceae bacterium]
MKKIHLLFLLALTVSAVSLSQPANNDWKKIYRAVPTKVNDLVHTKLNARFDYTKSQLLGDVWITLRPHFYTTDSLQLDAKGMDIQQVAIIKGAKSSPLKYTYNGMNLFIQLDKSYTRNEQYTIYIKYTAKPDELEVKGSAAITDAKGLYFINPKGEEKDKPTQIWTQGETEASSVWIPTIDKTNQKTTQEFNLTFPNKYVSLSNGKLVKQTINKDGTRTDSWKMDLPHAPYLFFIGIGDYAVIKDKYKDKEVNYYVEKEYAPVARKIFGNTPEMMKFFSEKLGVEYPWVKYSQIVGRDYVSGAMENTTATLHQESAQQDARELTDGNSWESTVAHELFHQWFGDYVTAESWSNLTVNESFADYSQFLWEEYKYGNDAAAFENWRSMQSYLNGRTDAAKDLVRFYYADKEDMFDLVSYQKGGRVLHMLRIYVGDDAFFKSLNKYLTDNKFGNGSAHKLRLAFEAITGKDLNWYFNQWYFGSGHPKLDISYNYNADEKKAAVYIKQTQEKLFQLPMAVDVYEGANKKRYMIWASNKNDTFYFPANTKPDLINVDAEKITLAEKKDAKTLAEFAHQFKYGGKYLDRREAVDFASKNSSDPLAYSIISKALYDPFFRIRLKAFTSFGNATIDDTTLAKIESIAKNDPSKITKAEAISFLGKRKNAAYTDLFKKAIYDSSYSVAGAALEAYAELDGKAAYTIANTLAKAPAKGRLQTAINSITIKYGDESAYDFIIGNFIKMPLSQAKFQSIGSLADFLAKVNDPSKFKKAVDEIIKFREEIPQQARAQTDPFINNTLKGLAAKKEAANQQELADYIKGKIK